MLARIWEVCKREGKTFTKTFGAAWLLLNVALVIYCLLDSPKLHGAGDVLAMLTFGFLICAFYTFWPAFALAACRSVYRILGWGAYVGAFLIALGVVVSLTLFRHLLGDFFVEIFTSASLSGPCGGHAGGPAALLIALICLVGGVVSSPASWWALIKLFLAVSAAVLLGSLPGVLLWLVLIVRKVVKVASASVSR
jgi:hypothetical protein